MRHPFRIPLLLFLSLLFTCYGGTTFGTYRPGVYFGAKSQTSDPLSLGFMWARGANPLSYYRNIRHECLSIYYHPGTFYWKAHDGSDFGVQEIVDKENNILLNTSFVKTKENEWTLRVSAQELSSFGRPLFPLPGALFFYIWDEHNTGSMNFDLKNKHGIPPSKAPKISGTHPQVGEFNLFLKKHENAQPASWPSYYPEPKRLVQLGNTFYCGLTVSNLEEIPTLLHREFVMNRRNNLPPDIRALFSEEITHHEESPFFIPTLSNSAEKKSNFLLFQLSYKHLPFDVDFIFINEKVSKPTPLDITTASLVQRRTAFEANFERCFGLHAKEFSPEHISFAQTAFSNLMGGIGWFVGESQVSLHSSPPEQTPPNTTYSVTRHTPSQLLTAVPSRSFFPRGFLWDEGFHQLIIANYDPSLSRRIIDNWFALMDDNGWIPREQILGVDSERAVPSEFQVQHPWCANPPSFLLPLDALAKSLLDPSPFFSDDPSASSNIDVSAVEFLRGLYPFLGRYYSYFLLTQAGYQKDTFRWRGRSENHTMCSGLDDYPRGGLPNPNELHLDLQVWMIYFAGAMDRISQVVDPNVRSYKDDYQLFLSSLNTNFFDPSDNLYKDLVGEGHFSPHYGYVNLYPFLLLPEIHLHPEYLPSVLSLLSDENHLWSPHGLRSLSRVDPYFGIHDNYWTGPIWININYLALSALSRSSIPKALELYPQLRNNIISNMFSEYKRTGQIWESYHPINGSGRGVNPFTGWSALIVLIMAEKYI